MIDFKELARIINSFNSFLVTTHVHPDADAIGSQIAFCRILEKLGKKYWAVNHSDTPQNLKFIDSKSEIEKYNPAIHKFIFSEADVLVTLDLNHSKRIISMVESFTKSDKYKICIDHHEKPENFVDKLFVDTSYAATGEILFDFLKETKIVAPDKSIADPLYAAIMTDTGSFRFAKTSPRVHRITAELLELGVRTEEIFQKIYEQSRPAKLKLLGKALTSLKVDSSGKISYMVITRNDINETGADDTDVEGFVNYTLSIADAKIGLLFFELDSGLKISFRSRGTIPVNKLAEEFAGGGHLNASGARLFNVSLQEYVEKVTKAAYKYLD